MKNIKALPMAGLTASSLLFISSLISLVIFIFNPSITLFAAIIHSLRPIFIICILLGLRYILVTTSKFKSFKIVIDLLVIIQVLVLLTMLIVSLKILKIALIISIVVLGLIQIVLFVRFLILLFDIERTEVKDISFLKYFFIVFLVFSLAGTVIYFINKGKLEYYIRLMELLAGSSSVLLALFFYKNQCSEQELVK